MTIDKDAIAKSDFQFNGMKDLLPKGWKLLRLEKLGDEAPKGAGLWAVRYKKKKQPYAQVYGARSYYDSVEIALEGIASQIRNKENRIKAAEIRDNYIYRAVRARMVSEY